MDINVIRGLGTVFALFAFLCIVAWAYSSRRKDRFEDDGMIPFNDENDPVDDTESTNMSAKTQKTHDDKGTE